MAGGGFKDRSVIVSHERPCPICGRPESGDPRSKAKCRVSLEDQFDGNQGDVMVLPAESQVHCFRVDSPVVDGYEQDYSRPLKTGHFYVRPKAAYPLAGGPGNRSNARPKPRPKPKPLSRLELPTPVTELNTDQTTMSNKAADLWHDPRCRIMDKALAYLVSRGLDREGLTASWPAALMFHPAAYNSETGRDLPAMLCRVTAPDGAEVATHRIYLNNAGTGKAELEKSKLLMGPPCGGAIRLGSRVERDAYPGGVLVVCEGVETAMAIRQATDHAVWALISTSGIRGLMLPVELIKSGTVSTVIIAADVDRSDFRPQKNSADGSMVQRGLAGQKSAREARDRYRSEYPGLRVVIAWPGATGVDS